MLKIQNEKYYMLNSPSTKTLLPAGSLKPYKKSQVEKTLNH